MGIFFFIVTIYSSANLYLFYKLNSLINLGTSVDILIGAVVFFMTISPVLIPVYSNIGSERSLRIFSYVGYMWLGFVVSFFPVSVLIDLYNLSVPLIDNGYGLVVSPGTAFVVSLLLALLINVYGFYEASHLRVERLVINTPKLPEGVDRIRIAQISDLHLGIIVGDVMLKKVIQKITNEAPDVIVSTGDLVDGTIRHIRHLPERLKELSAPLGKFAVMGNHEIYGGKNLTIKFIKDSGFTLLRGEGITAGNIMNIAGMDFKGGEVPAHESGPEDKPEHEVLSGLPEGLFTLLLKHQSNVEDRSLGLFDLQLSGHTHGGQIFPMNLATMFIFSYHAGFAKLAKGSVIYTSRGTGTSGPPIRFLSAPEITIIDIIPTI
jgi:predicted MPP superfamily phosphohydrolase